MNAVNMQQLNNTPMIIATLLTTLLMDKFKFQTMYYGMIHGLLISIISMVSLNYLEYDYAIMFNKFDVSYLLYVLIIPIFYAIYWKIKGYYKEEYLTINIYSSNYINIFNRYIALNNEYYQQNDANTEFGNVDLQLEYKLQGNLYSPDDWTLTNQLDQKIEFDDKNLNIKGYFMYKKKTKNQTDKDKNVIKEVSTTYIELNIIKNKPTKLINPKTLLDEMADHVSNTKISTITLVYHKILAQKDEKKNILPYNHAVKFYSGKKEELSTMENRYIKTLFHPKRDELWEIIKNNILNPNYYSDRGQVGRISFLFYGPPGTGKSTFAYRIAMCLFRHIISLDLRILNKTDLYKLLNTPSLLTGTGYDYTKYIYLFEEFDISVKYLYYKQMNSNRNKNKYLNVMETVYDNKIECDDKSKTEDEFINCERDEFTLRDLLEIFQGAIPFSQMIMLASTNKYEDIKKLCPELFRPGRMTPIYFGYIDRETLQEISMYFFKKKLQCRIPNDIKAPTSEIIEIALDSSQKKSDQFAHFSKKINELLNR